MCGSSPPSPVLFGGALQLLWPLLTHVLLQHFRRRLHGGDGDRNAGAKKGELLHRVHPWPLDPLLALRTLGRPSSGRHWRTGGAPVRVIWRAKALITRRRDKVKNAQNNSDRSYLVSYLTPAHGISSSSAAGQEIFHSCEQPYRV